MKKRLSIATSAALVALSATLLAAQPAGAAETINIADADLRLCVNVELGQLPSATITTDQALKITRLECYSSQMQSLSGLENFTNLQDFSVQKSYDAPQKPGLSDLTPIANLTSLQKLSLPQNLITDLSALKNLSNLTDLQLRKNNLTDISGIAGLTKLSSLDLSENQLSDISALTKLNGLVKADLNTNKISVLPTFTPLPALSSLNLDWNTITDVSALKPLVLPGRNVSVSWERIDLPGVEVRKPQLNPLRDLNGAPVHPIAQEGTSYSSDFSSWRFGTSGPKMVEWDVKVPGFSFAGKFEQLSVAVPTPLRDDAVQIKPGQSTTIDVLANDGGSNETAIISESLSLVGSKDKNEATLILPQGTFKVVKGKISFTPSKTFKQGTVAIHYWVYNNDGIRTTAKLSVTVVNKAIAGTVVPTATAKGTALPINVNNPQQILVSAASGQPGQSSQSEQTQGEASMPLANTGSNSEFPLSLACFLLIGGAAIVATCRIASRNKAA
ncbi:leucine-rich repeat domain-containing protein [Psychromicrobium lacuslunae]|uniref:leucine-rich repeat domain-containing protein n=1 Tax=Psychromicrobium lacuslunae TaxID=1618207 RepID=UPI0006984797|nr:leucine-rich repeat domain-containing protein [Psychromicrobium lacuslunae]